MQAQWGVGSSVGVHVDRMFRLGCGCEFGVGFRSVAGGGDVRGWALLPSWVYESGEDGVTHVWFWNPQYPGVENRKGLLCRVLVRGRMNSVAVELETGERVVCSRYAIRRIR